MNKAELIESVSIESGQSKAEAERSIDALVKTIQTRLSSTYDREVKVAGLGTFSRKQRAARTGRNPKTGEAVNIPAKVVPVFVASKALKEAVK